jgi:hypothetical protein
VQKLSGYVGKITGSETLGRIAGAVGSAFAGGKIDVSSTSTFTKTAGAVAKDIAVNETKRVVKNEVLDHIGSPFLQMAAGYAVNYGIDVGADYAYDKLTGPKPSAANDKAAKDSQAKGTSATSKPQDSQSFDVGVYANKALDRVGEVSIGDAIKQLAPKELRGVLSTIVGGDVRNFTVSDLVSAVKEGLNNFEGMTASDVAAAVQDYVRNTLKSAGNIDSVDIARYTNAAFDQAGKLKVQDLVKLSGYDGGLRDPAIDYLAREAGTSAANLTLTDVINFAVGHDKGREVNGRPSARQRVAG